MCNNEYSMHCLCFAWSCSGRVRTPPRPMMTAIQIQSVLLPGKLETNCKLLWLNGENLLQMVGIDACGLEKPFSFIFLDFISCFFRRRIFGCIQRARLEEKKYTFRFVLHILDVDVEVIFSAFYPEMLVCRGNRPLQGVRMCNKAEEESLSALNLKKS